jgi:hypothetical protein
MAATGFLFFLKKTEISVCVFYRGTIYWLVRISEPHGYKQLFAAGKYPFSLKKDFWEFLNPMVTSNSLPPLKAQRL